AWACSWRYLACLYSWSITVATRSSMPGLNCNPLSPRMSCTRSAARIAFVVFVDGSGFGQHSASTIRAMVCVMTGCRAPVVSWTSLATAAAMRSPRDIAPLPCEQVVRPQTVQQSGVTVVLDVHVVGAVELQPLAF